MNAVTAAVLGVVLYNGAFTTEIIRAGLQAVHKSQIEAGLSIGMSRVQVFFYIVIRPALEKVYPALSSQFVLLMLATSVISAIGVDELTSFAGHIQTMNFRSIEVYLVCIVIYFGLTLLLRSSGRMLGRRLFRYRHRDATAAARVTHHGHPLLHRQRHFLLLQTARWTLFLAALAFIGGGIVGARSRSRASRRAASSAASPSAMSKCCRARRF